MSVRNRELKTSALLVADATASLTIGGVVPTGMKRWITFLQFSPATLTATAVGLHLASVPTAYPSVASVVATTNRKLLLHARASDISGDKLGLAVQIPHKPNADTPLFSIGSGKYCGVVASYLTAQVFIQYYDE